MNERITERDLILPALQLLKEYGKLSTSEIIKLLEEIIKPTGKDAQISPSRGTDTLFSQKVRNLMGSHYKTNTMNIYTNKKNNKFSLTSKGEKLLEENGYSAKTIIHSNFNNCDNEKIIKAISKTINTNKKVVVYNENDIITEGEIFNKKNKSRTRSSKLRQAAIKHYTDSNGVIKCAVCDFDFGKVYHEHGKGFIEMHHEHPIFKSPEDGEKKFIKNAIKDIKPVCANCHRMIHRDRKNPLSIEELKKIIKD